MSAIVPLSGDGDLAGDPFLTLTRHVENAYCNFSDLMRLIRSTIYANR